MSAGASDEPRWVLRGITGRPWATLAISGGAVRFEFLSWGAEARTSLLLSEVRGVELRRVHDPALLMGALASFVWAMWDLSHRPAPHLDGADYLAAAREVHDFTVHFAAKVMGVVGLVSAYLWRRGVWATIYGDCEPAAPDDPLRLLRFVVLAWAMPLLLLVPRGQGVSALGSGSRIAVKIPGGLEDLADGRDFLEAVEVLSLRARFATRARARSSIARASGALSQARVPGLLDAARSPLRNSHLMAVVVGAITALSGALVVAVASPRAPHEPTSEPRVARTDVSSGPTRGTNVAGRETPPREHTQPVARPAEAAPRAREPEGPAVTPSSVMASSVFRQGRQEFPPELAFDGDRRTAWNEGVPGNGVGEWIEARYASEVVVRSVTVVTGWDAISRHGHDLFVENAHIRRATLILDGREVATTDASVDVRVITFSPQASRATTVRVRVDDVWPGTRYEDLCVSEVTVDARDSAARQPPAEIVTQPRAPSPQSGVSGASPCVVAMPGAEPFHLRPTDTRARSGAAELPGGTRVELLRAGDSWRDHNAARSYYVRVAEGDFVDQRGFVFLHPSELEARPECPR